MTVTESVLNGAKKFQSPRNRVKCSDLSTTRRCRSIMTCFNPLEIGSSVLIRFSAKASICSRSSFNPLEIGSSVLIPVSSRYSSRRPRFNPLEIGSSVLMDTSDENTSPVLPGFNPLEIGSSVLIGPSEMFYFINKEGFQSPRNRVKCSDRSFRDVLLHQQRGVSIP